MPERLSQTVGVSEYLLPLHQLLLGNTFQSRATGRLRVLGDGAHGLGHLDLDHDQQGVRQIAAAIDGFGIVGTVTANRGSVSGGSGYAGGGFRRLRVDRPRRHPTMCQHRRPCRIDQGGARVDQRDRRRPSDFRKDVTPRPEITAAPSAGNETLHWPE